MEIEEESKEWVREGDVVFLNEPKVCIQEHDALYGFGNKCILLIEAITMRPFRGLYLDQKCPPPTLSKKFFFKYWGAGTSLLDIRHFLLVLISVLVNLTSFLDFFGTVFVRKMLDSYLEFVHTI